MRVLYDVAPLGNGAEPGPGRTGIFRVVQGFVDEVMRRADLDVRFCALPTWYGEIQLQRFVERSDRELMARTVHAWSHPTVPVDAAIALVDRAARAGEHSQVGGRALTELAFLAKGARALPVDAAVDVYHSFRSPLEPRDRVRADLRVLMVHDLIPILFPDLFDRDHATALRRILDSIGPDDLVVANSRCTRDDLLDHAGLRPERVVTIPLAADPALFHPVTDQSVLADVRARLGIHDAPYLLSVATLEPRKGIRHLLDAFFAVVDSGQADGLRLVLAGTAGWMYEDLWRAIDAHPHGRDLVVLPGYVDDADLAALYSGAEAFVYPSHYEGFGLPVLEAMACGTPVVTSTTPALTELTAGSARAADPLDTDDLAAALLEARGDRALGERGLRRSREFSWQHTVDRTLAAYRTGTG